VILDIRNLAFGYNGSRILEDIDLQVEKGELLAVLGPNGSGKTTLLKCINAIHRASSGTILVEDRDVLKMAYNEIALGIGYVAQKIESSRLTVFDAVLMGRKPHIRWRVSEWDKRIVDGALKKLDLADLSLRYIDELSGGELQKVAIGRALVQEPRLLLLDEPTSSLDMRNQVHILSVVRHIVDEHAISAVMTMHDLNSALRYADRYCFLKNGMIHGVCDRTTISSEIIEDVYGLPVIVEYIQGSPVIVPQTDKEIQGAENDMYIYQ
jgi:iron complex transport system ATP-binding protein